MTKEERAAKNKKYREANKEKVAARKKKWYEENKEKRAAQSKKYYEENKEELAAQSKKYHEENKEKLVAKNKKYREENKEKLVAKNKKYYEENKEKLVAKNKKYREENKEKTKKYNRSSALKKYGATEFQIDNVSDACEICGKKEGNRRLAVDHHHGDHEKGKPSFRGMLCGMCNTSIGGLKESHLLLAKASDYILKYERARNEQRKQAAREANLQLEII